MLDAKNAYGREDIQGDVLPGFRARVHKTFHQRFLLARLAGDVQEAREGLGRLLDVISTGSDVARSGAAEHTPAFVNVAFTAGGLERLGFPSRNPVFTAGLARRSVEQPLLGDPSGWEIGGPGTAVDMLINIASTEQELVAQMAESVRGRLGAAYTFGHDVDGELLPEGREHFGFRDGLAQPYVVDSPATVDREETDMDTADTAVWPNWKALRLRAEAEHAEVRREEAESEFKAASDAHRLAVDELVAARTALTATGDVTALEQAAAEAEERVQRAAEALNKATPAARTAQEAAKLESHNRVAMHANGAPIRPVQQFVVRDDDEFMDNGSYMVWLKLEQRPAAFWAMCRELAARMRSRFSDDIDEEAAAARLLGRHLDGAALVPHSTDRPEAFGYYADPFGRVCPAGAHVRLTNPRDVESAETMILRRGITYGQPVPDRDTIDAEERGLIFVCYQADIEHQYEKMQIKFANADYPTGQPSSRFPDAIISQKGHEGSSVEIAAPDGRGSVGMRLRNTWVVPHGGLYLFVPSMAALRMLCLRSQTP